jgi:hypothetical protein
VTASSVRPVALRGGVGIEDPLRVVLGFLKAPGRFDVSGPERPASFGEPDLRLANRGGARISAAQIAAILQRRRPIEAALGDIPAGASLSGEVNSVPWLALRRLFGAFADIRGVGLPKTTKALYPKGPALIPMLDSLVQAYCETTTPAPRLPSPSARSRSSAATSATWTATRRRCKRSGRISRVAATDSPRCGSLTC